MNGVELIAAERKRQIEKEGWTTEHDDGHDGGELANAAACYAATPSARKVTSMSGAKIVLDFFWPFSRDWWKPTRNRVHELAKAGALIAAEIDRLQRAEEYRREEKESKFGDLANKSRYGK